MGQGSINELKQKDFKAELLKREQLIKRKKNGEITAEELESITDGIEQFKRVPDKDESGIDFIAYDEPSKQKKIKRPDNNNN